MAQPKFELEGSKFKIEFQKGNQDLVVNIDNPKQSVYLYKCNDVVVRVKGKLNSVAVDGCTKASVVFDSIISTVEVVNSKRVQLQANGALPNVTVDKTEGVTLFIQTEEGKKVELVTSASTDVNIVTPGKTEDDDPKEHPIAHQFVSTFQGDKIVTKPVEHVGV
jgi:adenylyl cyclase-associated protein